MRRNPMTAMTRDDGDLGDLGDLLREAVLSPGP
jgi:hypothetical protein